MEAKKSLLGTKRYPRKIKWEAVKKKDEEGWTSVEVSVWLKEIYDMDVPESTINQWKHEYKMLQNGILGSSSAEKRTTIRKKWDALEDNELKNGVALGLSNEQIAECMNEDQELNNRIYTLGSIIQRKHRLGLSKEIKHNKGSEQRAKDLLRKDQKLLQYINCNNIKVKCNTCSHEWMQAMQSIIQENGCPMCILPPNSYYELYVIEFPNFGNPSVKVGISIDYYNKRQKAFPEHKLIELYKITFQKANKIEKLIMKQYGIYRTTPPELHKNGSTECYDISMTNKINKTIKEKLHG
jgi:hypothetical protein